MARRLAAILAADVVGYSRLMEADEAGTLASLNSRRAEVIDPLIGDHGGRIVKLMGDGMLVEFASVVDAVACAVAVQQAMAEHNAALQDDQSIALRIGVNLGDVIVEGDDIFGDGVNVAVRLEALAEPGGVCLSGYAHDQIAGKLDHGFADGGEQTVKNIARPIHVWRWSADAKVRTGRPRTDEPLPLPDKPSIAVLPFTNMSGDPEQEYFSDGITEDIITELSRFRSLFVIARNSSFTFKGQAVDVKEVGERLGVAYVVEGSVRKAGNRVRVTAQLVEAATGNHLWAERYDRELEDIFAVQDELVEAIASALPIKLESTIVETSRSKPTKNLSAHEHYLHAEWLWRHNRVNPKIEELLQHAIAIDPNHARAYARLATYYSTQVFQPPGGERTTEDCYEFARRHAEDALRLGGEDTHVLSMAAHALTVCGAFDLAETCADRAMANNPNDAKALADCVVAYSYLGDHERAMEIAGRARRLDPLENDTMREIVFDTLYMMGRYEDALAECRGWQSPPAEMIAEIAAAHAMLGDMESARQEAKHYRDWLLKTAPDYDNTEATHSHMCRRPEDAERWIEGYRKAGVIVGPVPES